MMHNYFEIPYIYVMYQKHAYAFNNMQNKLLKQLKKIISSRNMISTINFYNTCYNYNNTKKKTLTNFIDTKYFLN